MRSAKKGSKSMNLRQLDKTSYQKTRRLIDTMTIEMYQDITSALLHDSSPIKLASDIFDEWEIVAQSLYRNNNLSHREFLECITRIGYVLKKANKSLGLELDVE